MGYDYDHVLEELNNIHGFESNNNDSSTNSDITGYKSENTSDYSDYKCVDGM